MKYIALLLLTVFLVMPASASNTGVDGLDDWKVQVVDYVYVNDTINETILYSVNTSGIMDSHNWSVNGTDLGAGIVDGNNYSFSYTWDNHSIGTVNTIIFTGMNDSQEVEFRWYVNVYEKDGENDNGIFSIMDTALSNHVTDLKIRMFKYHMDKNGNQPEYKARLLDQLHDEIAKKQMTREALRDQVKEGLITQKEYVAALKQAQKNMKADLDLLVAITAMENEQVLPEGSAFDENENRNGKNRGKGPKNQD